MTEKWNKIKNNVLLVISLKMLKCFVKTITKLV